jgi:hypothetical protein
MEGGAIMGQGLIEGQNTVAPKMASGYFAGLGTVDISSYGFTSISAILITQRNPNAGNQLSAMYVRSNYTTSSFTVSGYGTVGEGFFWLVIGT